MSMVVKLRRAPGRIAAGTFILNSGLAKWKASEESAGFLHGTACNAYPVFGKLQPQTFTRALAVTEIALGGALLTPVVPAGIAGGALTAFSGGLLGVYWQTPGMHEEGNPRPTQQGTALAKDVWMAGIGAGLVADALVPDVKTRRKVRRAERRAAKAEAELSSAEGNDEGGSVRGAAQHLVSALPLVAAGAKVRSLQGAAQTRVKAQAAAARKLAEAQKESAQAVIGPALSTAKAAALPVASSAVDAAKTVTAKVHAA